MRLHIVNVKDYIYIIKTCTCVVYKFSLWNQIEIYLDVLYILVPVGENIVDYRLFCFVCCYFCVDDARKCPNHETMQLRQNTVTELTCILI